MVVAALAPGPSPSLGTGVGAGAKAADPRVRAVAASPPPPALCLNLRRGGLSFSILNGEKNLIWDLSKYNIMEIDNLTGDSAAS